MERELKNILIVKLSAIGDVIHALPVSYAIKETFPDAKLTWVVEPPSFDLLSMNPYVDKIILFQKKEFKSFRGFARRFFPFRREIQSEQYDAVLDLQGLFKSAAIAFFARSNIKLGICNMREMSDKISKPVIGENFQGHIVQRYLDTARAVGCKVSEIKFPLEVPETEQKKADINKTAYMNILGYAKQFKTNWDGFDEIVMPNDKKSSPREQIEQQQTQEISPSIEKENTIEEKVFEPPNTENSALNLARMLKKKYSYSEALLQYSDALIPAMEEHNSKLVFEILMTHFCFCKYDVFTQFRIVFTKLHLTLGVFGFHILFCCIEKTGFFVFQFYIFVATFFRCHFTRLF